MTTAYDYDMDNIASSYFYGTASKRYSLIGEVKFLNYFKREIGIVAGARGSFSDTENIYTSDIQTLDCIKDVGYYGYATAYGYLKNVYYHLSLAASGRYYEQLSQRMSNVFFCPEFQLSYRLKNWRFLLNGRLGQNSPSLSQLADTELALNNLEAIKGNPNLKDWWNSRLLFRSNASFGLLTLQNSVTYFYAHHPVMSIIERNTENEQTLFYHTYRNCKNQASITDNLSLYFNLSSSISASADARFSHCNISGTSISTHLNTWSIAFSIDMNSDNWNSGISLRTPEKSLYGQTVTYEGAYNSLYVNYSLKHWRFGINFQYLFIKDGRKIKETYSSEWLKSNETLVVPAHGNMVMLSVSWNFAKGKKRQDADIDINNEDSESGFLKY